MNTRRWVALLGALGALLVAAACTSSPANGTSSLSEPAAYVTAIRWYVDTEIGTSATPATGALVLYVAPADGKAISVQAQASVVVDLADMKDRVVVRFTDGRDDALNLDVENQPVKNKGVLLLVGPVATGSSPIDVKVGVYRDANDVSSFVMKIVAKGDTFEVTSVTQVGQS